LPFFTIPNAEHGHGVHSIIQSPGSPLDPFPFFLNFEAVRQSAVVEPGVPFDPKGERVLFSPKLLKVVPEPVFRLKKT
jgi:hypothetical protein